MVWQRAVKPPEHSLDVHSAILLLLLGASLLLPFSVVIQQQAQQLSRLARSVQPLCATSPRPRSPTVLFRGGSAPRGIAIRGQE